MLVMPGPDLLVIPRACRCPPLSSWAERPLLWAAQHAAPAKSAVQNSLARHLSVLAFTSLACFGLVLVFRSLPATL